MSRYEGTVLIGPDEGTYFAAKAPTLRIPIVLPLTAEMHEPEHIEIPRMAIREYRWERLSNAAGVMREGWCVVNEVMR